jgi:exopolyphosphatase/pppGpp-phosphohydrolase
MLAGVRGLRRKFAAFFNLKLRISLFLLLSSGTLILGLQLNTNGQSANKRKINQSELHAGIEIGSKSIKAIAIQISEPDGRVKIVHTEVINNKLTQYKEGNITPEAIAGIAQTVGALYRRIQQDYQVLQEQTHIIVCSDIRANNISELTITITQKTGKNVTLLDMQSEASLSIAGTIPRRYQDRATWFDNRGMSALIDVGNGNIKGGYQQIRIMPKGKPDYVFFTFGIPHGTLTFTDEVLQAAGSAANLREFAVHAKILSEKSVREPLQQEMEKRPGLITRKKIYLSGGIVWAMVTLLYPQDRQSLVPITAEDIDDFYTRAVNNPESLLRPNLSQIRIKQTRLEAEKELETVRSTFTPQNLVAGAEILRNVARVFELTGKDKEMLFARFSNLSLLLSYLRLQADNGPQP